MTRKVGDDAPEVNLGDPVLARDGKRQGKVTKVGGWCRTCFTPTRLTIHWPEGHWTFVCTEALVASSGGGVMLG